MNDSDVIVVGAGIGGAVLALGLGSRGWKVKLLERERAPIKMVRPEILWGPTPAALDRFGVGDIIRKQTSVKLSGIQVFRGNDRLLTVTQRTFKAAKIEAFSTDPGQTREAIARAAVATGNATIERGVEVRGVLREEGKVVGIQAVRDGTQVEERARLIVGDDGANSVMRKSLLTEANFPGLDLKMFPIDFITAPLSWPAELPPDQARVFINPRTYDAGLPAAGCLPWPGGSGVLLIPAPHQRALALMEGTADAFWAELARVTPLANQLSAGLVFPRDFRRVQRPYGHAAQYVADGAAIIGDAAHPVSPAGGQGANASIWDALALADVAHEALTAGDTSRSKLARYELLRRPRNRASVRITELVVSALGGLAYAPGIARLIPAALRTIDSLPFLQARAFATFGTTFVTR